MLLAQWRDPHGEELRRPTTNSQWETCPLSSNTGEPGSCQHGCVGCRSYSQWRLEIPSTLDDALMSPHGKPWARDPQRNCTWIPDSQKLWGNKCLCFKPLNLWVICSRLLYNSYRQFMVKAPFLQDRQHCGVVEGTDSYPRLQILVLATC